MQLRSAPSPGMMFSSRTHASTKPTHKQAPPEPTTFTIGHIKVSGDRDVLERMLDLPKSALKPQVHGKSDAVTSKGLIQLVRDVFKK